MKLQTGQHPAENRLRVDVMLPVYNEENDLARSCETLSGYLEEHCPYDWRIVIADNASTDRTPVIGRSLEAKYSRIKFHRLEMKGRGRALIETWLRSDADIVSYMDIDLSTDLKSFLPMINAIASGSCDIAIGSRFTSRSEVERGLKREVLSRGFITLIKILFPFSSFSDAQCGFKAASRGAVRALVPLIKSKAWFFDTELLILADRHRYKIENIPVNWTDDPDSRVKIVATVLEHSLGVLRMRLTSLTGVEFEVFYPRPIRARGMA
jgi:glycosyltransferase involved in cell wall biosynthesis